MRRAVTGLERRRARLSTRSTPGASPLQPPPSSREARAMARAGAARDGGVGRLRRGAANLQGQREPTGCSTEGGR